MTSRVLCVGLTTLDIVQSLDHLPKANEKAVARSTGVTHGGPAANAASVTAALGSRATLVTVLGRGLLGRLAAESLRASGVGVHDALPDETSDLAVSTVLVDVGTGDRAVVSTNATGLPPPPVPDADTFDGLLAGVGCVLVDGHHVGLCTAVAREARRRGIPVLFDGGSWKPGTDGLLPHVDIAVLSADFREKVPLTSPVVVRSDGPNPLRGNVFGEDVVVDVPDVAVVDTFGAGDVLHGAALYALARLGCTPQGVRGALRFATEVASLSCAAAGARGFLADTALRDRALALRP